MTYSGANTTEEIKARLNIVDVVGSYIQLTKAGTHWKACCPFHQERTPSFMVNTEKNIWHCFGCGKGGDVFSFVMEMEGLEFKEALRILAERAGVELPRYTKEERGVLETDRHNKERLFSMLELATRFYEKQLWDGPGKGKILAYLHNRGISDESIRTFRLGYAPDGWRHLSEFLTSKEYAAQEMEQAGLIIQSANSEQQAANNGARYYDRFRDRIMFPIQDILGRVIGYSARMAPGGDESQAKYINTPETSVYHKSRALYGLYQAKMAIKQASSAIVVEGNMDVIAMHQAGCENTVAVSGTALTDEQLSILKRYGNDLGLFFDMDGAGQQAARKSAELSLAKEMNVSIIAIPSGKDAADIAREHPEWLREAVARPIPAPKYFLDAILKQCDRTTADGKRRIVGSFAELLAVIKNPLDRAHWVKELSREIGTEEKLVAGVLREVFAKQAKRSGGAFALETETEKNKTIDFSFGKRSERLREELIGLMLADGKVRQLALGTLSDDTRLFFEKHPLYFFVLQAGNRDPLSLIDDRELKKQAIALSFRILESPDVAGITDESEKSAKMATLTGEYLAALEVEVGKREKLRSLERDIVTARQSGDKEQEKRLLAEFGDIARKLSS